MAPAGMMSMWGFEDFSFSRTTVFFDKSRIIDYRSTGQYKHSEVRIFRVLDDGLRFLKPEH
jgi:hypothetical protein